MNDGYVTSGIERSIADFYENAPLIFTSVPVMIAVIAVVILIMLISAAIVKVYTEKYHNIGNMTGASGSEICVLMLRDYNAEGFRVGKEEIRKKSIEYDRKDNAVILSGEISETRTITSAVYTAIYTQEAYWAGTHRLAAGIRNIYGVIKNVILFLSILAIFLGNILTFIAFSVRAVIGVGALGMVIWLLLSLIDIVHVIKINRTAQNELNRLGVITGDKEQFDKLFSVMKLRFLSDHLKNAYKMAYILARIIPM